MANSTLPSPSKTLAMLAGAFFLLFVMQSDKSLKSLFSTPGLASPQIRSVVARIESNFFIDTVLNDNKSLSIRDDFSCSADKPCSNGACCGGAFTPLFCGYGDTYCGSTCVSQCSAVAECGKDAKVPGTECPLNVCCSQFGFCGTTADFCDVDTCQSNCGSPSIPAGGSSVDVRDNVIGYYESWASVRTCHNFPPAAIPVNGLQRINFAFAYIDPTSLEVTTMDATTTTDLFKEVADVKSSSSSNLGLEVYVSIGGWTFNDNQTVTQPLFSEIAGDSAKRLKFATNVLNFLTTYGFDGVDLDWEYPGAGDRGGVADDVKNYPLLMKQIRETFDSSPGGSKFGITFTVPSSYWYLRWFDLPSMLPYITSINMMTYDLHGVWDKLNPIGNIVQSHTNLTEIKLAMDLLWRNDVPPGKVILGLGFYGRAFQLQDTSCTSVGCPFAGASAKGPCTGEGGILGYFEIMDILNDKTQTIDVIYDEEAAVNYFTYSKDQWISYDNATSFKAKVDWANTVGLGGLMIWAVDMDDNDFSALSGLLGRTDLGTIAAAQEDNQKVDTANWASQNGQQCYMGKCGDDCIIGKEVEISRANSCDGGKPICCPIDAAPSSCTWRGGESGRSCHGTCHTDEVTLYFDTYGKDGPSCFKPGQKVFCCQTTTYTDIINACHYAGCGKDCDAGYENPDNVVKYDPVVCEYPYGGKGPQTRKMCCPTDPHLTSCHWVGKGGCDQNNCDDNDIQLDLDAYGDSHSLCSITGRSKSLCCDSPVSSNPFLPVELADVFPTLPANADVPEWDLIGLGLPFNTGQGAGTVNNQGFGFVLIDGPKSAVTSLSKRDGSDYEFLDCPTGTERQTVRIFCNTDIAGHSNCHEIFEGGVEGTVIKLPDNCGPGTYAVAHSLTVSEQQYQMLPSKLASSLNQTVLDLDLSYNFGLVKRDAGDIYIRIDYTNLLGYWNAVVNSAGEHKKRSQDAEDSSSYDKRFFSTSGASWKAKFDAVRKASANGLSYTTFSSKMTGALIDEVKTCPNDDDNYASIGISGSFYAHARFGYSFVGTISPFNIAQAYGFSESDIGMTAALHFQVSGAMKIPSTQANVLTTPISLKEFSVPGLVHFKPNLQMVATLSASMAMTADFTILMDTSSTSPDGSAGILQYYPESMGAASGGATLKASISGDGIGSSTSGSARFGLMPTMNMDITINSYSTGTVQAHETISASYEAYIGLSSDGECPEIQAGIGLAQTSLVSSAGSFPPWKADESTTDNIPGTTSSSTLSPLCERSSKKRELSVRAVPSTVTTYSRPYVFGAYTIVQCAIGLSSSSNLTGLMPGQEGFCADGPDPWPGSGLTDSDGQPLEAQDTEDDTVTDLDAITKRHMDFFDDLERRWEYMAIEARGGPRPWNLDPKLAVGVGLQLASVAYPDQAALKLLFPAINFFSRNVANAKDQCSVVGLATVAIAGQLYAVEHLWELGNVLKYIRTSAGVLVKKKGQLVLPTLPSGATAALTFIPMTVWESFVTDIYTSRLTGLTGTAMSHVFRALGSDYFPEVLQLLEVGLNGLKQKMYDPSTINIIGKATWKLLTESQKMDEIMRILAVYKYMDANGVTTQLIIDRVGQELGDFATLQGPEAVNMVPWFNLFNSDHVSYYDQRANNFVSSAITEITGVARTSPNPALFLQAASIAGESTGILKSSWFKPGS